ncbi:MAG: anti-sigma factor family protein [Elainellaceae cyanobacterium]
MTSNFNDNNDSRRQLAAPHLHNDGNSADSPCPLDNLKRDCYETLSAYIDSELRPEERRQVEDWLRNDPEIQCLYVRLIQLRRNMSVISMQSTSVHPDVEETVDQVFSRLDRRPRRALVWGGTAAAVLLVSLFSGNLPQLQYAANFFSGGNEDGLSPDESVMSSLEDQKLSLGEKSVVSDPISSLPSDALMISVNEPLITAEGGILVQQ